MWWRISRTISAVLSACAALYASVALCVAATDEHSLSEALAIVQLLRAGYSGVAPWRRFEYDDVFGAHPPSAATSKPPSSLASNTHTKHPSKNTPTPLSSNPTILPSSATPSSSKPPSSAFNIKSTTLLTSLTYAFKSNSQSINITRRISKSIPTIPSKYSTAINLASSSKLPQYNTKIPHHHSNLTISNQILTYTSAKPAIITKSFKQLSLKKNATIDATDMTPELQQVAMELAGELNGSGAGTTIRTRRLLTTRPTARASWREHLPRSTRYAVPLPENHAFCYIHPRNALCRTFI